MKKRTILKYVVLLMIPLMLITGVNTGAFTAQVSAQAGSMLSSTVGTYDYYLDTYKDVPRPAVTVELPVAGYTDTDMEVEVLVDYEGAEGKSILTQEEGYVEWEVDIPEEGMYNIYFEYFPVKGRNSAIERAIRINGEVPFPGADHILFSRVWADATEIKRDNRGNDLRPRQIEEPIWQAVYASDYMGYYTEPYLFYFKSGKNTLRITSIKEPMVIRKIAITNVESPPTYEEILRTYQEKGYRVAEGEYVLVEGEHARYKSDPTLYPIYDRTSPATQPYHFSKIRLNTIGGYRWVNPGQWITWEIEVKEAGLYQIAIKARQNVVRGLYTNRKLTIDGKVPFKEVENIKFNYANTWKINVLGGEEEPYLFYLDEGRHEIRLEVVLGGLAEILRTAENSVLELNNAYRKILMITGQSPDIYRDYQLHIVLPGVIDTFREQSKVFENLSAMLQEYTGQRGSHNAILDRLAYQLADMAENPRTIPKRLGSFKDNVGALGTWVLATREQPLEIDFIVVSDPEAELPGADVGFLKKVAHEFWAFLASFVEDYNSLGDVYDKKEAVTVWIGTGRDQAQVLKEMIDDTFTPTTGIPVNLQLVQGGVLLPATVAKRGPDVAMQVGQAEPVNYATRNALTDLTIFPDFEEVIKRFHESAIVPFRFEGGVYALPEQQVFPMLFYRKDILEELQIDVPETWDDVFEILPVIQKNHMDFAVPAGGLSSYCLFLFQRDGQVYRNNGMESNLDSEVAIEAFRRWTELYLNYKLPLQYDIANRFRTGEVPIAISDYSLYNTLQVFAPELRGRWEFAPIPGLVKEDGSIDRSAPSSGTAVMMLKDARNKEAAWEFMKWWTERDTQVRFGLEMESLMGAAARYPTANMEALEQLPWPVKDYKALMDQWQWVEGIPEVPGGYFTPRHLDNAFRKVVFNADDHREVLLDYVRVINEEITNKRREFGLEIKGGEK